MTPDEVCEKYSPKKKKINIEVEQRDNIVIIRGNQLALEFLGELISSQASFKKDDGFGISPMGAGRAFFLKGSKFGIFIHRIQDE